MDKKSVTSMFFDAAHNINTRKEIPKTPKELVWNVFTISNNRVTIRNVFNYSIAFSSGLQKVYRKYKDDYISFEKEVLNQCMYAYWSKYEYEILITNLSPRISIEKAKEIVEKQANNKDEYHLNYEYIDLEVEEKIDVYSQILLNWDNFIRYLWENRKLIRKLYK